MYRSNLPKVIKIINLLQEHLLYPKAIAIISPTMGKKQKNAIYQEYFFIFSWVDRIFSLGTLQYLKRISKRQNHPSKKVVRDPNEFPKVAAIRQRIWLLSDSNAALKAASLENGNIVEAKKEAQNKLIIII